MLRRNFLLGIGSLLAAPAIIRFEAWMPVKTFPKLLVSPGVWVTECDIYSPPLRPFYIHLDHIIKLNSCTGFFTERKMREEAYA